MKRPDNSSYVKLNAFALSFLENDGIDLMYEQKLIVVDYMKMIAKTIPENVEVDVSMEQKII